MSQNLQTLTVPQAMKNGQAWPVLRFEYVSSGNDVPWALIVRLPSSSSNQQDKEAIFVDPMAVAYFGESSKPCRAYGVDKKSLDDVAKRLFPMENQPDASAYILLSLSQQRLQNHGVAVIKVKDGQGNQTLYGIARAFQPEYKPGP